MKHQGTSEFNESIFQFCFLHELIASIQGARHDFSVDIPTLRREAQLGYDACVNRSGISLFFQFKLAVERIKYSSKDATLQGWTGKVGLEKPYREFRVHSVNQHNKMRELAIRSRRAFYVAPTFLRASDLWSHVTSTTVIRNSALFDPAETRRIVNDKHRVIFYPDASCWNFYSDSAGGFMKYTKQVSIDDLIIDVKENAIPFNMLVQAALDGVQLSTTAEKRSTGSERRTLGPVEAVRSHRRVVKLLREAGIEWCIIFLPLSADKRY